MIPLEEVGTDPERANAWTREAADSANRAVRNGAGIERTPMGKPPITRYIALQLDGLWLRGPYLHNGSVPTVRALLEAPEDRPDTFYRGYDVLDRRNLGFVSLRCEGERAVLPGVGGGGAYRGGGGAVGSGGEPTVEASSGSDSEGAADGRAAMQTGQASAEDGQVMTESGQPVTQAGQVTTERGQATTQAGQAATDLQWGCMPAHEGWLYDTSVRGNGNGGHTWGVDLSDDLKTALVEYLKTF